MSATALPGMTGGIGKIGGIELTPAEITSIKKFIADNPKGDATYTNNPAYKMVDKYFRVNPVYVDPILKQFGRMEKLGANAMDKYIQYNFTVAKANGNVNDELLFTHGDSKTFPALRKAKFFQYGVFLKELEKKALDAGSRLIGSKVATELQASKSFMTVNYLKWVINYQVLTSEVDHDPEWIGALNLKPATGTATDPEDIAGTPGTPDAYAQNFTGTNKSKDFISNTFGKSQRRFRAMKDDVTQEQMLKGSMSANKFLYLLNPDNADLLNEVHPFNGVQDDQNITYDGQIKNLRGKQTILGSYDIDAVMNAAEDGTNIVGTVLNPNENFKIWDIVPFQTSGWIPVWHDKQFGYYKRSFMKSAVWTKAYFIGGSWKKAFHPWTYVYMNDA